MYEILILLALIVLNGVLAMSELAVVSSRPARLEAMVRAAAPDRRPPTGLAADPGRFLSTVQIGITLVGILSGAFGGATLGEQARRHAGRDRHVAPHRRHARVGIVVAVITYLSLIIGELVPKQIALRNPEAVACAVAPAMRCWPWLCAPLVWLLDISGRGRAAAARRTPQERGAGDGRGNPI